MNNNIKKRILIFSTAYFPFVGGAEVAIKEITDRLATKTPPTPPLSGRETVVSSLDKGRLGGVCFDMVTARISKDLLEFERVGDINVYRFGKGNFLDKYRLALFGHKFAQKLHNEKHYDAIWGIMASYGGFSASAFKKKNPNVPFLLTLQEGDPIWFIKLRALPMWFAFKNIFKRVDYVQAISNYLAKWAKRMGAKCQIEVVPNGFGKMQYSEIFESQKFDMVKRILGDFYCENDVYLITTSRLVKKNAVDNVIEAMKYLPENYKFLILGIGPDEEKLRNLAKELGVQDRVDFLGNIEYKDIPKYLAISDVFVRPSRSEGLGNSFLEAMASGVPIIGTNVGGIPDFLTPPKLPLSGETPPDKGELKGVLSLPTGLFCEVNNPKSIAEKVLFILDPKNEELKKQIIINAKNLVLEKYDWDGVAEKMRGIFDDLIK